MDDHTTLLNILCYLGAAVATVPLFLRLGLGAILGYLVAGVLIGPQVLHLISSPEDTLHVAEMGVVLLLFVIGLELNPRSLWLMRRDISILGTAQLLLSSALIGGAALLFGLAPEAALIIGLALGLSSTAFAIQLMSDDGVLGQDAGRRGFAILLLQDLAVIPILLVVQYFSVTAAAEGHNWWLTVAGIAAVLLAGRYLLNPVLLSIAKLHSTEIMTAAALLIVLGTAVLMEEVGMSMGMGAFLAGILLANSSFRHQLEVEIEPFKGLLLGLFFISIGMTLDLQLLWQHPWTVLAAAVALMAAKTGIILGLLRLRGIAGGDAFKVALMLSQGGEFAFVVMNKSVTHGILSADVSNWVTLVVSLSMALTSPLVALAAALRKAPASEQSQGTDSHEEPAPDAHAEVIIVGFGRFGQVAGRVLSANHIPFTALERDPDNIHFAKRYGFCIHYGDASRAEILAAAGADHARVMLVAADEHEQALAVVKTAREHFPNVRIIARARNRASAMALRAAGAHKVIREVFAGGLDAASQTLMSIGFTEFESIRKIEIFRQHDEELMAASTHHRNDPEKLLEMGLAGRDELLRLFEEDSGKHLS